MKISDDSLAALDAACVDDHADSRVTYIRPQILRAIIAELREARRLLRPAVVHIDRDNCTHNFEIADSGECMTCGEFLR